ncbi:MAG: tRNA (adenosine(37)-N6)-threonylcarbamoyltransferase complex transferase subunit TsaD [Planctomycetes bacterium]|nr:tRNA (adenosine(37)-N6)-threonylcarbamoyltransferase complex transferase subunit TsaD [Planctomycetota bacterium]
MAERETAAPGPLDGLILGIESSCDETAAALLAPDGTVRASVVRSQIDLHAAFGGVVPEIAGRSHVEHMLPVVEECFERAKASRGDVRAIAVTVQPGLIGSLLVGVSTAKALALALDVPLVPVDHVAAHVWSCFHGVAQPELPAACLVASGGHSTLFAVHTLTRHEKLGETIDDAAGEAFDKVSAILGLGYPGGPIVDRTADGGDPKRFRFPRSLLQKESLDFSFSGLKTAVLYHCKGQNGRGARTLDAQEVRDVCASFQEAVVDVLATKLARLAERIGAKSLAVGGGVASNRRLRARITELAAQMQLPLHLAPRELTTDNAVMVAGLGRHLYAEGVRAGLDLDAHARALAPAAAR